MNPSSDNGAGAPPFTAGTGFSLGFVDASIRPASRDEETQAEPPLGPYVLKRCIGEGGQGEVWEAWQTSLGRDVAVKIHRRGSAEAFLHEAILTGELDHPNIVPVLDLGTLAGAADETEPGAPVMAMKKITGARWDELIKGEIGTTNSPGHDYLTRHLGILRSVCHAVAYAHSRGIVHLDLKPSQVIVGAYGEVFLMDWGIAARLERAPGRGRCVADIHGPLGTPGYMAPEQALGDAGSIGVATDVYLLGAMAYHAATGRPLRRAANQEETITLARRNVVDPMDDALPPALAKLIRRALAALPADRHPGAEAFRAELEVFLGAAGHEREAREIMEDCRRRLNPGTAAGYGELAEIERRIDTARTLYPALEGAGDLRDAALSAHAHLAMKKGDLALARSLSDRIESTTVREAIAGRIDEAESERRRREEQRVRARRGAFAALVLLVAVLVLSANLLYRAFRTAERERARAEQALAESQQELARSSIRAAASHLANDRPSDARESLRHTPVSARGWEWGYLASAAMPEYRLLRPRTEAFERLSVSPDDSLVAAIRLPDRALLLLGRDAAGGRHATAATHRWTSVAPLHGGRILAGTEDGTVAVADRGGILRTMACGDAPIRHLAAAPDGIALAADDAGTIWRLDTEQGSAVVHWKGGSAVQVLSISGNFLAFGLGSGEVLHGSLTASPVLSEARHSAPVAGIAWKPGSADFATWAVEPGVQQPMTDDRAIIHRVGTAEPLAITNPGGYGITAAAWTPDGNRLLLAFSSVWLYEMDPATWSIARSTYHPVGIVHGLRFADDGSRLMTLTRDMVQQREWEWFQVERSFGADSRRIADHAVLGNGHLVLCGPDGGIREWRFDREEADRSLALYPDRVTAVDAARNAPLLASAHQWGWVKLWNLSGAAPQIERELWYEGEARQVRLSADGRTVLTILDSGVAMVARLGVGDEIGHERPEPGARIVAGALSADGSALMLARDDGTLARHGLGYGGSNAVQSFPGSQWTALEYLSGGEGVVAGDADGRLVLLDAETLKPRFDLIGHTGAIRRLYAEASGRRIVSASADETARLWDAKTGDCIAILRGTHAGVVNSAFLTADGRRVITACADSMVRVFELESGTELVVLHGHQYGVLDMAPSADGRRIFSTGQDSRLRTWLPLPWDQGESFLHDGVGDLRTGFNR